MSPCDDVTEPFRLLETAASVVRLKVGCLCAVLCDEALQDAELRQLLAEAIADGQTFSLVDCEAMWPLAQHQSGFYLRKNRFMELSDTCGATPEAYLKVDQVYPPLWLSTSLLPETLRYLDLDLRLGSRPPEQLAEGHVVYDGFLYLTIDSFPQGASMLMFPQEVREQLCERLAESPRFAPVILGPTPIHPGFTFLFFEDDSMDPGSVEFKGMRVYGGDLYTLVHAAPGHGVSEQLLRSMAAGFYHEVRGTLSSFYQIQALRDCLLDIRDHIQSHFDAIASNLSQLYSTSVINVPARSKCTTAIERDLSETYRLIVAFNDAQAQSEQRVAELRRSVRDSEMLGRMEQALLEDCASDIEPISAAFFEALKHAQSVTSLNVTYRTAILAALLGGIVGSLVYPLVSAIQYVAEQVR